MHLRFYITCCMRLCAYKCGQHILCMCFNGVVCAVANLGPPPFLSRPYMALRQKLEVLYTVYAANLDLAHGIPVLEIRVNGLLCYNEPPSIALDVPIQ